MKRTSPILAAGLLTVLWFTTGECQAANVDETPTYPAAVLTKPYAPVLGDMIALNTSELLTALRANTDPPTVAIFDRDAEKVAVCVYGTRGTLDAGKKTLDLVREKMRILSPMIGYAYHVTLKTEGFGYIYFSNDKELVRWEDGKYTVASE